MDAITLDHIYDILHETRRRNWPIRAFPDNFVFAVLKPAFQQFELQLGYDKNAEIGMLITYDKYRNPIKLAGIRLEIKDSPHPIFKEAISLFALEDMESFGIWVGDTVTPTPPTESGVSE